MKNLFFSLTLFLCIVFSSSCKKENPSPEPIPAETELRYFPLKTGNYWVYDEFIVDSLGIETDVTNNYPDTMFITMDSLINGAHYYYLFSKKFFFHRGWVRDSAQCLVDINGYIQFKQSAKIDTILRYDQDTMFKYSRFVHPGPFEVETKLGLLTCSLISNHYYWFHPQDAKYLIKEKQYNNSFFAKDIGMITLEYMFQYGYEKYRFKLREYHLEK